MGSAQSSRQGISEVNNLFDLLSEIQEEIFSLCSSKDLKNFACSSSESNEMVKKILWKNVKIPWEALAVTTDIREDRKIKNLIHTRGIRFEGKPPINDNRVKELLRPNFLNIMQQLNQQAIEMFAIINLPNARCLISLACEKLKHSKTVILIGTKSISRRSVQLLSSFHRLRDLNLSNSNIDDEKLISLCQNLTALTSLDIGGTSLEESSLFYLAELTSLKRLVISDINTVTDEVIRRISFSLKYLRKLDMRSCQRFGSIASLRNLSLKYLDITKCSRIDDFELPHINSLKTLKGLSIERCINLNKSFHVLSSLIFLESLNVAYTNIDDEALEKVKYLEFLSGLNISGCTKISHLGFQCIGKIRSLKYLNMKNTRINGATLEDIRQLLRLLNLRQTDGSAEEFLLPGQNYLPSDLSFPESDPIDML